MAIGTVLVTGYVVLSIYYYESRNWLEQCTLERWGGGCDYGDTRICD